MCQYCSLSDFTVQAGACKLALVSLYQQGMAAKRSKTDAEQRSQPNTDASAEDAEWTERGSEYSGGFLGNLRLGYTQVELGLIANSKEPEADGSLKRTLVRDTKGRSYTMAGMNRYQGDFTVRAGFLVSKFNETNFHPYWIRQPDGDDPPEAICKGYVPEMRKGRLSHRDGRPIRPDDTIGMFHDGMILLFPSEEDLRKETEVLAKENVGLLPMLVDDISPGASPR